MKLLRRRAKTFDIQVQDLTLHITAPEDFAEESRAAALSFWEQLQSYGAARPGVPHVQARPCPRGGRRAADRARDGRGGHRRRGRADVHVPGRRGGLSRAGSSPSTLAEVTVAVRRRLLHPDQEADEVGRAPPRRRTDHVAVEPAQAGSGSRRRSAAGAAAPVPTAWRCSRRSCMLADAAAAGVQALLPKHDGFGWRCDTSSRCRGCAAAWSSSASGSASPAAWRSRMSHVSPVERRPRARRGEASGRGAPRADQPPLLPVPRARRPRGRRRRVRRAERGAPDARGPRSPSSITPDSPTQRVGARRGHLVRARRAPGADALARQRVLVRGAGGVGRAGRARARRTGRRLRVRAEDRRGGVRAHVRAGPAGPRRDARRRARRRGHHRQRPHGPRGCRIGSRSTIRRRWSRSAARCTSR